MSWPASRTVAGSRTVDGCGARSGRCGRRSCSASPSSRCGSRRRGLRLEAVLPAQAVEHLGRRSSTTSTQIWCGGRGLRPQRPRSGSLVGTVLGVAVSFLLMRFRLLNDMLSAAGHRPQRDPDLRARRGVQQHVRHHVGDPAAADGHAGRVLHRPRQRRQGLRQVEADAPRAAALVRRHPDAGAEQGARSRTPCRTCSRRSRSPPRPPSSRPSSPSTSAARRTGSATASRRTIEPRTPPSPGPTCSAPACSGWCST